MRFKIIVFMVSLVCYSSTFYSFSFLNAVRPNTVVATITVGVTPAGIAITPDSRYAYVANNNNYGLTGPDEDSVTVIDLATNLPKTTIFDASFNEPYTVTINPAGTLAYVTNSNSTTVTIINVQTNTVIGTINGFDGPSDMAINAAGTVGYVNNYGSGHPELSGEGHTVSVVNLVTNTITATVDVGTAPAALAITPNGQYVYVINYVDGNPNTGTVSVIRTSDNSVTTPITSGLSGPFGISISPDGTYAYVTNFGSNNFDPYGTTVSVINLKTNTIVDTVTLGIQPSGVGVTPDNRYVYAANYNTLYGGAGFTDLTAGQGTVNVIDTTTDTLLPVTILVGSSPSNITISPNGEFAYVSNFASNTVSVIAVQSFQITATGCKMRNRYLNQIDFINKLTWTVTGTSLPVEYFIYRDANLTDLAGTVDDVETLEFFDHNRNPNVTYTYYIVGVNQAGTACDPVVVTVTNDC